jgi:Ca2+-dependent lipid-binding protein
MAVSFTGVLKVCVVEATDLKPTDLAGAKTIDPYCVLSIDDTTFAQTTHKPKSFNPRWNEV